MNFVFSAPVRFAHCDPAGIAYFPRLFELFDAAIEDWTARVVGVTRAAMHGELRRGLPTVDLHASFSTPSRLGEILDIAVAVTGVGSSSVGLAAEGSTAGSPRFSVQCKQVLMDLDTARAIPWPAAWRERLTA